MKNQLATVFEAVLVIARPTVQAITAVGGLGIGEYWGVEEF